MKKGKRHILGIQITFFDFNILQSSHGLPYKNRFINVFLYNSQRTFSENEMYRAAKHFYLACFIFNDNIIAIRCKSRKFRKNTTISETGRETKNVCNIFAGVINTVHRLVLKICREKIIKSVQSASDK